MFITIANRIPEVAIMAVGMTFVLIVAGIDLSVGSVMAFSGAVFGVLMSRLHVPLIPALLAGLLIGLICGAANGWVTNRWRLPSFIVTLGMLEIARGAARLVTGSQTQQIGASVGGIASALLLGLSFPFFLTAAFVIAGQVVLSRTVFGRYVVAVGTNEEAARLAGIDARPVKLAVFALSGLLSAIAAIISTSRIETSDPNIGRGVELQVIAAVVIGGTSLLGGRGSVVRTFLGVLIIDILEAGLAAVLAGDETKQLITGCVIVAAVILDYYRGRRR